MYPAQPCHEEEAVMVRWRAVRWVGVGLLFVCLRAGAMGVGLGEQSGFMGGINAELRLTDDISIQPELMYVQRAIGFTDTNGTSVTAHYNCLELPILLKIKFLEGVRPYVFGGPVGIINISRSVSANGATTSLSLNPSSTDFAVDLGAGVEFGPLFVNLRYSIGIANINQNAGSWSSRGIEILAGIEF
jgi:opacity protein-like surface antigen